MTSSLRWLRLYIAAAIVIDNTFSLIQPTCNCRMLSSNKYTLRPNISSYDRNHRRRQSAKFISHFKRDADPLATSVLVSSYPTEIKEIVDSNNVSPTAEQVQFPIEVEGVQIGIDICGIDGTRELCDQIINGNIAKSTTDDFFAPVGLSSDVVTTVDHSELADDVSFNCLNADDIDHDGISTRNVDENTEMETSESPSDQLVRSAPSISRIIKFAIPAIGVWLCGPILSLIDTSAVGLLSGTKQQAALSPSVAICDYSALLLSFMYTATTNLIASAREDESSSTQKPRTTTTLVSALQISGFVGAIIGSVLILTSKFTVRAMIGNDSIDPEIFNAAIKYVNIRALGMPAAAIIGSAQAACLGMQDIKSPLYVLLAAAIVNFFGDVTFVGRKSSLLGGAAGAAWATTFSQYAALLMFIKWLTVKSKSKTATPQNQNPTIFDSLAADNPMTVSLKREKLMNSILELSSTDELDMGSERPKSRSGANKTQKALSNVDVDISKDKKLVSFLAASVQRITKKKSIKEAETKPVAEEFTIRGFLAGKLNFSKLLNLPPLMLRREFYPFFLPVTATCLGRVSAYIAMAHVVASSLGPMAMASQQIITSTFYCLCPIADSLSLTAQSFVPGIYDQSKKSLEGVEELKKTSINFVASGALFSVVMTVAALCIPLLARLCTTDLSVLGEIANVTPVLAGVFLIHGVYCASEGLMLGQKDLSFIGRAFASFFFIVPWFMLRLKRLALAGNDITLKSVWGVFLLYQWFRGGLFLSRLVALNNRGRKQLSI